MVDVILNGWEPGLEKVRLNKLLREHTGLSLGEAKDAVDRLLENEPVIVRVESLQVAPELVTQATQLGAHCQSTALEESKSGFQSSG